MDLSSAHPTTAAVSARVGADVPHCRRCGPRALFLAPSRPYRFFYACDACDVSWAVDGLARLRHLLSAEWPRCPEHPSERLQDWNLTVSYRDTALSLHASSHGRDSQWSITANRACELSDVALRALTLEVTRDALRQLAPPR